MPRLTALSMAATKVMKPLATQGLDDQHKFRVGIGMQLYLFLMGSVLLTLSASLVAYFSFRETLRHELRLAEYSMPNLINSVDVARHSTVAVNGAFRMMSASSQDEHDEVTTTVGDERTALETIIQELESRSAFSEQTHLIRVHLTTLDEYLVLIQQSSRRRLAIDEVITELNESLSETNRSIERYLVKATDDQGFYIAEGLRSLYDQPHPIDQRASAEELATYRDLTTMNLQANLAVLLLDEVMVLNDRLFLQPLEERFYSATENFRHAFSKLPESYQQEYASLKINLGRLAQIGGDSEGVIALRRESLRRLEQEQETLKKVRSASDLLVSEINHLVEKINHEAISSSEASRSAARTGIFSLILINLFSTGGAIFLAWFFVGRYLLRRLIGLAGAMRQMANGDLDVPVKVGGDDEITDMAKALEVFRRYAREVQRLNLVEKLAEELDSKNANLEQAMGDLKEAQQQIIAEQKLASLGQLTAGVAHEIKNPLNFVGNFSIVATELTDEIEELLEEEKTNNPDAFKDPEILEEIADVFKELRLSLSKIIVHSKRADGIVHSMLEHSRGSAGEWRDADLNALLKQYVELSYHALRAEEPNFNMAISEDLDPDMGLLQVIPQDICRVFLNLATNACQALNEKQQIADKDYEPELRIASKRLENHAEFRVRDNGPGIPESLKNRIMEPFVTSKAPGKGTGLGLSLSTDILVRHGGSLQFETEEGSFTEMCVLLPLEPPAHTENSEENQT